MIAYHAQELLSAPDLNYPALVPVFIIAAAACLGVITEAVLRERARAACQAVISVGGLVAALVALVGLFRAGDQGLAAAGLLSADRSAFLFQGALVAFSLLAFGLFSTHQARAEVEAAGQRRVPETEIYPLALFSLLGMMVFVSSNNLIMLFVALEVMSLPLYVLAGLGRRREAASQEAALKYFILGVIAGAILLFGVVFVFASTGSLDYAEIAAAPVTPVSAVGIVLIVVGLLFKVGAVPFHSWVPDVYQGSPTPVTAFMAIGVKLAAFAALVRVLSLAVPVGGNAWEIVLVVIALVTMLYGAVVTVAQPDIKRLIAYSSITHAGFILTALVVAGSGPIRLGGIELSVLSAVFIYLVAYGLAAVGALGVLLLVRDAQGAEETRLSAWSGIGRQHPWLGAALTVFFVSFAGLPPTIGLLGKVAVFATAWVGGYGWLVTVALLVSAVAAYAYLRVVVVAVFGSSRDAEVAPARYQAPSLVVTITIAVCAVLTVLLGVLPGLVFDVAGAAGTLVF